MTQNSINRTSDIFTCTALDGGSGVGVRGGWVNNLGLTYTSNTLSVTAADGTALSAANPGYVTMQDKSSPGVLKKYTITANQGFIDDTGSSEIIGNLFGLTTSVAWIYDIPFFIYAVTNDAEDAIAFMISRMPGKRMSPVVAEIGAPDDAVADEQYSFFSFDNIDETLYDANPCLMIGSIRMQMSASDDWTVSALEMQDGIGRINVERIWYFSPGQRGAASGKYFRDNGGTAPVYTSQSYYYVIHPYTQTFDVFGVFSTVSTAGVGAVTFKLPSPFEISSSTGHRSNAYYVDNSGGDDRIQVVTEGGVNDIANFYIDGSSVPLQNQDIDAGDDLYLSLANIQMRTKT